jgi:hypothetical protein
VENCFKWDRQLAKHFNNVDFFLFKLFHPEYLQTLKSGLTKRNIRIAKTNALTSSYRNFNGKRGTLIYFAGKISRSAQQLSVAFYYV